MHHEELDNATVWKHIYLITPNETMSYRDVSATKTNVPCTHVLRNTCGRAHTHYLASATVQQ